MDRKKVVTRALTFEVEGRSLENGIPVTVSTDAVVEMPDGPEILVHSAGAVNLERAPLPIIATHRNGQINVGVIDGIQVDGSRMSGFARFGAREEARAYETDVLNKIIRAVSVGYYRNKGHVRKDGVLVTTRWTPSHAAMVAEPADINAGFYRSQGPLELEDSPEVSQTAAPAAKEELAMTTRETAPAAGTADVVEVIDHAAPERLRIKDLQNLARSHKINDETRDGWIDEGISVEVAAKRVLDMIAERTKRNVKDNPAHLSLTTTEVSRYSITRAIKACVEQSWPKVAPYEAEVSNAVAQRIGRSAAGANTFFVPLDVQWAAMQQRDLIVGTASAGGYLVGTNVMSFIELLRNRSVVMRLGATTMPGLVGSVSIPKQLTAATANWFASEAGTATESNLTFGQVTLVPKTVGGYVELSRQLLLQSTPNAEGVVNNDLARVLALAVDSAALSGPGTAGQPTGISATSGVGTANPSTGSAVSYADMIRFQTTVAASNAMMPGFGYVTTPTIAGILMGKPRFTNSDTPIWGGNILDGTVVGATAMSSNQIGSGTMFGGDFSNVIIGEWGVLEIEANPYAQFQAGIIGVRALYTVDVAVRYAQAFAIGTGMTG